MNTLLTYRSEVAGAPLAFWSISACQGAEAVASSRGGRHGLLDRTPAISFFPGNPEVKR